MPRSIIDIVDLSTLEIAGLMELACQIIAAPQRYAQACAGKKLATVFYEPSTRTRLSFEAAMYELGGHVLGFADAACSSAAKGESLSDTAKTLSCYADIVAIRHPREGAAMIAAAHADVPVINAGDGGHCHPTQTLADLLTIYREKGRLDHLHVGFCGDLKYGRTVHSLINALSRYEGVEFTFIAPEELEVPGYVKRGMLQENGRAFTQVSGLEGAIGDLDILYMTRIQRERFADQANYERLRGSYILDPSKLTAAKGDLCIMHPLPRVDEISPLVDDDPRACYFKQMLNGKYIRMALILKMLEEARLNPAAESALGQARALCLDDTRRKGFACQNPRCITQVEPYVDQLFKLTDREAGIYRCCYCESKAQTLQG